MFRRSSYRRSIEYGKGAIMSTCYYESFFKNPEIFTMFLCSFSFIIFN